jgi:hypothetical protein
MAKKPNGAGRHLKITVLLLQKQIAALDHLAVSIRLRTGVALSRASIINALIKASMHMPEGRVEGMLLKEPPLSAGEIS